MWFRHGSYLGVQAGGFSANNNNRGSNNFTDTPRRVVTIAVSSHRALRWILEPLLSDTERLKANRCLQMYRIRAVDLRLQSEWRLELAFAGPVVRTSDAHRRLVVVTRGLW